MNTTTVLSLSRRIIRRSRHTALQLKKRILPPQKKLLFVYGGRTQHWPSIGRELYEKEQVFRHTIQQCDALIREIAGVSILKNFEEDLEDLFGEEANVVFTIGSIQIALFELWKSKGKNANAMLGISLGEAAAVYAAGGLSMKDTLKVMSCMAMLHTLEPKDYAVLFVMEDIQSIKNTMRQCPVSIIPIYEAGQKTFLVFCHKNDLETLQTFLNNQKIGWKVPHQETSWPYHTALLKKHRKAIFDCVKDILPKPLQCDYYSGTLGGLIQKNTIIPPEFWVRLAHSPVLTYSAFQQAKNDGFNVLVNIGPNLSMKTEIDASEHEDIIVLDTMRRNESEEQVLKTALRRVQKRKIIKSSLFVNDESGQLEDFKKGLNFLADGPKENPYPYFRYLRRHGPVHHLGVYNAWIVLDYEEIDYVLKHPELFSSSIYSGFDSYLLGSDPPAHTLVRSLLQPLFSPQVFSKLGEHAIEKAHQLLDKQQTNVSFNIIEEFSLPLARFVAARFLGLTDKEEADLDNCVRHHVYSLRYLDELELFFKQHLQHYQQAPAHNVASFLLSAIKNNQLSFDGAVSLMRMLWIAGMTTTSALLGNAILMLAENPAIATQVRENEQLINKFIEECLRLETPESELKRITTQDVRLGNAVIPAESVVMLGFRAANRDPRYFENPDEISLTRPLKRHLSFGGGYHYCLGAGLARLESKHALKVLLDRMPDFTLTEEAPEYFPSEHFRGLTRLMVIGTIS